jgi:predicted  nucleic acid-binding Zn-ribbon protein
MKKRNMKLPKRLLSMSLALSMCVGMACTTAFADDAEDYVYVYVGVDVVDTTEPETPDFSFKVTEEQKQELEELHNNVLNGGETADRAFEEIPESKHEFDAKDALQEAVNKATEEVDRRLDSLDKGTAKPEYTTDVSETEESVESTEPAETEEPTYADQVNDRVDHLNEIQEATDATVSNAQDTADKTLNDLITDKDTVDNTLNEEQGKLTDAKAQAEAKVQEANKAIADCEAKRNELQASLDQQISSLEKPAESFRERGENESEADYVAAQNAWVAEYEAYNTKVTEIKAAAEDAQRDLDAKAAEAQKAVQDAQNALNEANEALDAFNNLAENEYNNLTEKSDAIKDHNEKLNDYNEDVGKYNEEVDDYNKAADAYNQAVDNYNTAAGKHNIEAEKYNTAVDKYNKEVGYYNEDVEAYNTAAGKYNEQVDTYNDKATDWNTSKAQASILESELQQVNPEITVEKIQDMLSSVAPNADGKDPWADLSDEDYNAKVDEYNAVVNTYNQAVKSYNEKLSKNPDEVINDLVQGYFDGQQIWTTETDNQTTHWYTLGKIDVKGNRFGSYAADLTPNTGESSVYTWTVNSDGTASGEQVENRLDCYLKHEDPNEAKLHNQNFTEFVEKLEAGSDHFEPDSLTAGNYKDLIQNNINRWVLTAANGANDGSGQYPYVPSNRNTWHLNGYLHVEKLSELVTLEKRAVLAKEKETISDTDKAEIVTPLDDTKLGHAEHYNYYATTLEVEVTAPSESWTAPPEPTFGGVSLNPVDLDVETVPDRITVTEPDNTTPPVVTEPDDTTPPVVTDPDDTTPPVVTDPDDTDTDTNVPEEEVPLVEAPVVDVPEEEVPLVEAPVVDIPEEEVPLVEAPAEVEIEDDEVPLAAVPQTGDISALWYVVTLLSACGLAVLTLRRKEHG